MKSPGGTHLADVFISHSSKDRAVAEVARDRIEQAGFRCWMAPRDILPGQDYGEAIVDAIRESRIFLLIFSSASVDSAQVRRETERAANARLAIIPFRIEDVQPSKSLEFFISSAHWLDAFEPPMDRHFDYLVEVIGQRIGAAPVAAGPPPAPRPAQAESQRSTAPASPRRKARWPLVVAGLAVLASLAAAVLLLVAPSGSGRNCTRMPDIAQTGFTLRATPVRSDKPLWLRGGPSPSAAQLTAIGPDEIFRIAPGQNGEWWSAQLCDGTTGFVASRYVSLLDPQPASPQEKQ
ncbi:MAG TPA: TIR domain-containing protein [Allosphingosinicella sp.]|nr:TIR domain-containing protein [Allosphingosinicella sp.]